MTRQLELPLKTQGEARQSQRSGEALTAASGTERSGASGLMARVLARPNMLAALKRVRKNKGSPGIDGLTVQVLQPRFDPTFSEHSHGFRPGRRAHDAVREAQQYVQAGHRWVVDVDLKSFFDRVNHDVLMGMLSKRIADKTVLGLIRRYLEARVMANDCNVYVRSERARPANSGRPYPDCPQDPAGLRLRSGAAARKKKGHRLRRCRSRQRPLCANPRDRR